MVTNFTVLFFSVCLSTDKVWLRSVLSMPRNQNVTTFFYMAIFILAYMDDIKARTNLGPQITIKAKMKNYYSLKL